LLGITLGVNQSFPTGSRAELDERSGNSLITSQDSFASLENSHSFPHSRDNLLENRPFFTFRKLHSMKHRIFLHPRAGLANRLLAVLSGIRLAELFDRELVLVWQPNSACSCKWSSLFATEFEEAEFKSLKIPKEKHLVIDASDVLHRGQSPLINIEDMKGDIFLSSNCIFSFQGDSRRGAGFWVYEPILVDLSAQFQRLQLQDYVVGEVDRIRCAIAGKKTIGLHVRRGTFDREVHQAAFGKITDEVYEKVLAKYLLDGAFEQVFLASDSVESDARISAGSPAGVIRHEKRSYAKNSSEEAIQDALVDLMGLAHSDQIIGSASSSFCYVASMFRLIPYTAILNPKHEKIDLASHYYLSEGKTFSHRSKLSSLFLGNSQTIDANPNFQPIIEIVHPSEGRAHEVNAERIFDLQTALNLEKKKCYEAEKKARAASKVISKMSTLVERMSQKPSFKLLCKIGGQRKSWDELRKNLGKWNRNQSTGKTNYSVPCNPQLLKPAEPVPPTCEETQSTPASVAIVVCVHNALKDTQACLASLIERTPQFQLFLVNDGSDVETTEFLRDFASHDPEQVLLLESGTAEGYTKAANRGLRASMAADYVVLLNSDTIVTEGWLDRLLACARSNPRIGIVGPLSNAASYQSIPEVHGPDKDWAVNPLPEGKTPDDIARIVSVVSARRYPTVPFVNGFCFLIKRETIAAVGFFDEEAFPEGYGEENDYCLRTIDAGFELAIADDAYVFHAKSKSFSHERRKVLAAKGNTTLKARYGEDRMKQGGSMFLINPVLREMRKLTGGILKQWPRWEQDRDKVPFRVLFLLPSRGQGGGSYSVVQEAQGLLARGLYVQVAVKWRDYQRFQEHFPNYWKHLFVPFDGVPDLLRFAGAFDFVIATTFRSVSLLKAISYAYRNIIPAYYVQDYEPWFTDIGTDGESEAIASYKLVPGAIRFAKTHWLCETVHKLQGVPVHKVVPSLDHEVYYPGPSCSGNGPVIVAAMVRPQSARRAARETMEVLGKIKKRFASKVCIKIFGCEAKHLKEFELPTNFDFESAGILVREEVAELLRQSNIFVDFSTYQAFGRTALEAMACGCATVVPALGGTSEYARHLENCLVVDTSDLKSMFQATAQLVSDSDLRKQIVAAGLRTSASYDIARAVQSERALFQSILDARREIPQPGQDAGRTKKLRITEKSKLLFFTCCSADDLDFVPLFALSALLHNPDSIVEVGIEDSAAPAIIRDKAICLIRAIFGEESLLVRAVTWKTPQNARIQAKTARFINHPAMRSDYVCIVGTNLMVLESGIVDARLAQASSGLESHRNERTDGTYFAEYRMHYPLPDFKKIDFATASGDIVLDEIIRQKGCLPYCWNPVRGIRLSPQSSPSFQIENGDDTGKLSVEYCAFRSTREFKVLEPLLSQRVKGCLEQLDQAFSKINNLGLISR